MAALTWRDVAAPDFRGSLDALRQSGQMFNDALSGAQGALAGIDANKSAKVNRELQLAALRYQDPEAFAQAMAEDPTLGFDPRRVDAASINMLAGRSGQLLDQANSKLDLEEGRWGFEEKKGKVDRMNAAAPILRAAAEKFGLGDDASGLKLLTEANIRPDEYMGWVKDGMGLAKDSVDLTGSRQDQRHKDVRLGMDTTRFGWEGEDRQFAADAAALAQTVLSESDSPESALYSLERNAGRFNPRAVAMAREMITGQIGGLYQPSGGSVAGGGGGGASANLPTDAVGLIAGFEGFREGTYWDVNHHRVGYGSDTITRADGTVVKTKKGDRVSQADAQRDLNRRIGLIDTTISKQVGSGWAELPEGTRSAITSVVYNYGEGATKGRLSGLMKAARSGDTMAIGREIRALAGDNNGVNRDRRLREAALAAGGGSVNPSSAAIRAKVANSQDDNSSGASGFMKGLDTNASAAEAATALRSTPQFKKVPQNFLTTQIAKIRNQSKVTDPATGVVKYTLNHAQAADILRRNLDQENRGTVRRVLDEWFSAGEATPNLGGGLRLNDAGVREDIERARSGATMDSAINMDLRDQAAKRIAASQQQLSVLQNRVASLRRQVAGGRKGLATELDRAESELAAATVRQRALEAEDIRATETARGGLDPRAPVKVGNDIHRRGPNTKVKTFF